MAIKIKQFFDYSFNTANKLFCENLGIAFDKYGNNQNFKIDFRSIRFPGIISINSKPSGGTSDYAPEMIHSAIKIKIIRVL